MARWLLDHPFHGSIRRPMVQSVVNVNAPWLRDVSVVNSQNWNYFLAIRGAARVRECMRAHSFSPWPLRWQNKARWDTFEMKCGKCRALTGQNWRGGREGRRRKKEMSSNLEQDKGMRDVSVLHPGVMRFNAWHNCILTSWYVLSSQK